MALDNIELDNLQAGDDVATDLIATDHYQYVKITYGAAGTANEVTSTTTNPFPVALSDTDNAVLDSIAAAQLPDGHAVTVDNASGASAVNIQDGGNSITVDNGGTFAVQATLDAETTKVIGTVNIAAGQSITADLGANNDVTVTSGTITANLGATDNAVLDTIETNTDFGTVTGNGTAAGALRVSVASDSTGVISVDDNGGSLTIDGTVTADLGANNDVTVTGGNAHDGTTLGNPVLGGARATNSVEGLTQVANADLTYIQADLNGVTITRPHTTLEEIISERISNTNGTSTNFTNFAAGGAGVHNYVTTISIYNSSATDGYVDFRDGSAGSVIFTAAAPATGGSVINLPVPLKGAANTALAYDVSGALSTVYISVVGFQAQG